MDFESGADFWRSLPVNLTLNSLRYLRGLEIGIIVFKYYRALEREMGKGSGVRNKWHLLYLLMLYRSHSLSFLSYL
jgi:hypothetical protein